ncbi:MAG: hypothetical protein KAR20_13790 [Candidatus Heimdallarchaeota archaeon]|nr:hypothetical protein [Candidatus Heimdallarchaeota archaeon]
MGETDTFCKSCGKQFIVENKKKSKTNLILAIAFIVIASLVAVYILIPETRTVTTRTVTTPTDNEITYIETNFDGNEIYRWNNYYFIGIGGDVFVSSSLSKLKDSFIIQTLPSASKEITKKPDGMYRGYTITLVELRTKVSGYGKVVGVVSQTEYIWIASDVIGNSEVAALEKETLTTVIDNKDFLINALSMKGVI